MQYRMQKMALRATAWLAPNLRARWLTTFYEFHRFVVRGQVEQWLMERARSPKASHFVLRALPLSLRYRIYGAFYVLSLHRRKHVLPGVWRFLDVDAAPQGGRVGLGADDFPVWLRADLGHLAEIEAGLFPKGDFYAQFHHWSPHAAPELGTLYAELLAQAGERRWDVVVVAPWLREGGADKGILQYLGSYARRFRSVLLITTYPIVSSRLDAVPPAVRVLEIGHRVARLPQYDQALLLARLFLQWRPALIHNVLSELCWRTYRVHGRALRSAGIKLAASLFSEERTAAGERLGYMVDFVPHCRSLVDAFVTDNRPMAAYLERRYGVAPRALFPIHFCVPAGVANPTSSGAANGDHVRILWAGRVCEEKLPDIVLAVARRLPDVEFDMYGRVDAKVADIEKALRREHNVKLHGPFRNFHELAQRERFDAFLYTTAFDGMPNVLLEAAAEGIPIIAPPSVGGLSDFADDSTVFCVADHRSVDAYVDAIGRLLADRGAARQLAENARARVAAEFSEQRFEQGMDALVAALQMDGNSSPGTPASLVPAEPADVVLVVPWVRAGGADKGILQFADYYRSRNRRVVVVTTLPHDSPWADRLPEGVRLVEMGRAAEGAGRVATEDDLQGFLEEAGTPIVHVVQSDLGWRTIAKFGRALRRQGVVFAGSLFVREPLDNGETTGYADLYLGACRDLVDWVITDNTVLANELVGEFDVGERRVRTVHFWVDTGAGRRAAMEHADAEDGPILWAGRICRQKSPELLLEVARRLAHRRFHVYGEADDAAGRAVVEALRACPNVDLMGRFDSFPRIAGQERYGCFLYTTLFDGLPNVILEAAASGIPIVAPASIGGLGDFVDAQTAFVVADARSGAEFATSVEQALSDPQQRRLRAAAAFDRVAGQFGRDAFVQRMDALFAAGAEPGGVAG